MAQGVLIALLGQATKISNYLLQGGEKVYSGSILLGKTSDTWDITGKIIAETNCLPFSHDHLAAEIALWTNVSEQTVPPFSAAKQDGTPLYVLARKGEFVERTKKVQIYSADLLDYQHPIVKFRVKCSSGTYVRSLAHSLGTRLGCGAVLSELMREYSYPFGLASAVSLDDVVADPSLLVKQLHPICEALRDLPCFIVSNEWAKVVRQGQTIPEAALPKLENGQNQALLMYEGCELALVRLCHKNLGSVWQVTRGLWN